MFHLYHRFHTGVECPLQLEQGLAIAAVLAFPHGEKALQDSSVGLVGFVVSDPYSIALLNWKLNPLGGRPLRVLINNYLFAAVNHPCRTVWIGLLHDTDIGFRDPQPLIGGSNWRIGKAFGDD